MEPFIEPGDLTVTADDQVEFATARIRSYCRWHIFPSVQSTVRLDTGSGVSLLLPSLYVTVVASVTVDSDSSVVDLAGLSPEKMTIGVLQRLNECRWLPCNDSVTVVWTHGYAEPPDELRELAVAAAKRVPASMAGVSQEAADGVSRVYGAGVSAGWTYGEQQVLDKYRIPNQP